MVKLVGGGYFSAFDYTPTDYNFPKKLNQQLFQEHLKKQQKISNQEFKPVKAINKMKYEDPFDLTNEKKKYIFPFHLPEDVYEITEESKIRQRVIEEAKILYGNFLPPGKKRPYSKSDLEDIIHIIKEIIINDWPEAQIMVGVTEKETIEVLFLIASLNCQLGLLTAYMNALLNDERVAHFQLSRIVDQWAVKKALDGTLLFTIKPPWIHIKH